MLISQLKGLKYPDEYLVRFFFKEGLDKKRGTVLELGCGNGSNLGLFYQYKYDVVGIDIDSNAIANAEHNFRLIKLGCKLKNDFEFKCAGMSKYLEDKNNTRFDVVTLPSSIYYMDYKSIDNVFNLIKKNGNLKKGSALYIRVRTPRDYRFGKGKKTGKNCFKLSTDITGEKGCTLTFLSKSDLSRLLNKYFKFKRSRFLRLDFDNVQNGRIVSNSDIVFWGTVA